ncbi:MAG: pseudaminic acid cytidylyltransferase [Lachnospiraceae bacterium]
MIQSIAIITARGGSKRIPKKNCKEFCGKPIIAYSIQAALDSGIFSEVMVSTDDIQIKKIALEYGASVPFLRSPDTSGDYASTAEVLQEVLLEYKKLGKEFTYLCCLYPTAPFVTPEKIRTAMELLQKEQADTVLPVVPFSFPPQRALVMKEGRAKILFPQEYQKRSQDLELEYHDAGQFYCFQTAAFIKTGKVITDNTRTIVLDEMEVQDIDNESDWALAELKYQKLIEKR